MNTDSPGALSSSSQPDHPASPVRVEPVVIVLVQLAQRRFLVTGIELDDPDPAEIAAHVLDVTGQARRQGSVRRPDAVLVCLAVVPETPLGAAACPGHRPRPGVKTWLRPATPP